MIRYRIERTKHPLAPWEEIVSYERKKDAIKAYNSIDLRIAKCVQLVKVEFIAAKAFPNCFEKD